MRKMLLGLIVTLAACGDNYDTDARVDAPPHNGDAPVTIDAPTTADAPIGIDAPLNLQILTPAPYLSKDDSPFKNLATWYVEDFEDGMLDDVPGTTASAGLARTDSTFVDSVDNDDGVIDNQCPTCGSWYIATGPAEFTFAPTGGLPTHAGLVWTDAGTGAGASITFEAFDGDGNSLGTSTLPNHSDGNTSGATAEDRFFGVVAPQGVARISIQNSTNGIEIDHLQWGR